MSWNFHRSFICFASIFTPNFINVRSIIMKISTKMWPALKHDTQFICNVLQIKHSNLTLDSRRPPTFNRFPAKMKQFLSSRTWSSGPRMVVVLLFWKASLPRQDLLMNDAWIRIHGLAFSLGSSGVSILAPYSLPLDQGLIPCATMLGTCTLLRIAKDKSIRAYE